MSSYIQRLISRGVESFSNASSLGSVAKSQSPLAKNDQRLHELDISHTVNIPASSINEGDSFDNDQSNQRSEQKSTLSGREETQPTSNRQNSLPGQKSANARSKSTSHSPDLRSRELYKASLMNRNQRESDKPLVEETKIVERKEIYQSPIINKHVSEVYINQSEQPEIINYVEVPQRSVHNFEPKNATSNQNTSDDFSNNTEASFDVDSIISKMAGHASVSPEALPEQSVAKEGGQPAESQVIYQEIKATTPVNTIVQEYDSHNGKSSVKPSVIEKVIEKVVEKEVVNRNVQEKSNKQTRPATAESISKIGCLPKRNSVFSIFGSRG